MSGFSEVHYLNAIIAEIRAVRSFVSGMGFDDCAADLKTRYATERAILNISEAVRNLERHGRHDNPDFSLASVSTEIEWAKIKGIGNVMRHDYENVSASRVWGVVAGHLDGLEQACLRALRAG